MFKSDEFCIEWRNYTQSSHSFDSQSISMIKLEQNNPSTSSNPNKTAIATDIEDSDLDRCQIRIGIYQNEVSCFCGVKNYPKLIVFNSRSK